MTWDEAFASRYDEWAAHMTADVTFYVQLARDAEGPLVELAIGNGRVAIPVAQATDRPVTGIDSSPAMLDQARARAAEAGVELLLCEGDMRDLSLDEPAALIYCPFRGLLHPPTWADRRRTFEHVAASLGKAAGSCRTHSPSTTGSPPGSTVSTKKSPFHTRTGTGSETTGSTSRSTTARPALSGGRRRTRGSDFSTSPVSSSSGCTGVTEDSAEYVFVAFR